MADVFLSYASEDVICARTLASALERHGWSVFWDRTIPTGQTWRGVIGRALVEARCVVVLWSEASIESTWVQEEAEEGQLRGVLIQVLISPVRPPMGFRSFQAANLVEWNGSTSAPPFKSLIADIERAIKPSPAARHGSRQSTSAGQSIAHPFEHELANELERGQPSVASDLNQSSIDTATELTAGQRFVELLGKLLTFGFFAVALISVVLNLTLIGFGIISEGTAGRVVQHALFIGWGFFICALSLLTLLFCGRSLRGHAFGAVIIAFVSGGGASYFLHAVLTAP